MANLDVVAARIVEYVQSRFEGPRGRMEAIPVLLTVNEETEEGVEAWSKSRLSSDLTRDEVRKEGTDLHTLAHTILTHPVI